MTRKYLWILLCATLFLSAACQKAPELTLTSASSIELSADGSSGSVTFTANRAWTASASNSWVSVSPSSGEASDKPVTVTVRCNANTTYDDRTATVTIRMEDLSQSVTVRQPANLGILLSTQTFVLTSEARTIDVEVQANVQYTVETSVDWIKQPGTKGLTSTKYNFSIAENTTYDDREGKITIKSQNTSVPDQIITVKQAQKDAILVKDTSFDMPYGGGEIEFKVEANVAFDVKSTADWLHYVGTKGLSSSTLKLTVDENTTYDTREGKVEITQQNGSIKHTVTVNQAGRPRPHNTTYMWGLNNWDSVWPETTDNVARSADSTLVEKVFLKNDGVSMDGMLAREIFERMNTIIQSVPSNNQYKVRGAGTLNGTAVAEARDVTDSTKLVEMGFTFANTIHGHNTTYMWGVDNWGAIWPADHVVASADSILVKNVFLKNDGKSLNGMLTRDLYERMNNIIQSVPAGKRAKVRGAGTINGAGVADATDASDSTKLAQLGFAFANTEHPHATTYVWGGNNWGAVWPADNVVASADSVMVNNVFLKNDGETLSGLDVTWVRQNIEPIINAVPQSNRYKVHGAGELKHLYITDKNDSTWLSNFGFMFVEPRYKER